jgi:hypothetical protein
MFKKNTSQNQKGWRQPLVNSEGKVKFTPPIEMTHYQNKTIVTVTFFLKFLETKYIKKRKLKQNTVTKDH